MASAGTTDKKLSKSLDASTVLAGQLGDLGQVQTASGDGTIDVASGTVIITKGTAAALTLAQPTAGAQSAGGDDGKVLRIVGRVAAAHTVTTAASGINGNKHIETFANIGDVAELFASNGVWYHVASSTAVLS